MKQETFLPDAKAAPDASSDEWYTPPKLFAPLHQEFDFTLDAAATRESTKARRFFTLKDNGLEQPWTEERVWLNCPYSDIEPWVRKANLETGKVLGAQLVVMLLPCWTDRKWWHVWVEPRRKIGLVEVRFIQGRVRFGYPGNPEAKGSAGGGFDPSVLVIFKRTV